MWQHAVDIVALGISGIWYVGFVVDWDALLVE
jgi:hypothetical protein